MYCTSMCAILAVVETTSNSYHRPPKNLSGISGTIESRKLIYASGECLSGR